MNTSTTRFSTVCSISVFEARLLLLFLLEQITENSPVDASVIQFVNRVCSERTGSIPSSVILMISCSITSSISAYIMSLNISTISIMYIGSDALVILCRLIVFILWTSLPTWIWMYMHSPPPRSSLQCLYQHYMCHKNYVKAAQVCEMIASKVGSLCCSECFQEYILPPTVDPTDLMASKRSQLTIQKRIEYIDKAIEAYQNGHICMVDSSCSLGGLDETTTQYSEVFLLLRNKKRLYVNQYNLLEHLQFKQYASLPRGS